jgi:hypothetical protein
VLGVIESLKTKVIEDRFTCSKVLWKPHILYFSVSFLLIPGVIFVLIAMFFFQKKIEENRSKLTTVTRNTSNTSEVWQRNTSKGTDLVSNLLTSRQDDALCSMHSLGVSPAEEDIVSYEKQTPDATSTVLGGNPDALITPIKLPEVLRLPCYTTWTLLHRSVYNHMHFSASPNPFCVQKCFFSNVS